MLPQLYRPTAAEIAHVTASAARRHPALASRIEKAAEILSSGGLQLDTLAWDMRQVVRWKIASQSNAGTYVVVNGGCPCQDNRAKHDGGKVCKHSIAVASYMKILANRINVDIRRREIDLGILPNGEFNAWAKGMGHVQLRKVGTAYTFVDAASMVRYSIWLAAQPVSVAWPVAAPVLAVTA